MQDLVGRTVGQYRLDEQLGRGGMASVFKAHQSSLNRAVAIKVLSPGMAADPTFLERFRREATAVAGLQHPNILAVYDFNRDEQLGIFYIVMALVSGGTLREKIGALSLSTSLKIASQLADALHYAHSRNIVHRDVKPTNVLMARDDWALLADFGIARLTEQSGLTNAGTGIGTPEYMSPEQAMGKQVDGRSDVYALGVMLYEMATGRLPFTGNDAFTIMRKHVQDALPRPSLVAPNIPGGVEAIILRATEKDPASRFQTAGEMRAAIDAVLTTPTQQAVYVPDPNATVVAAAPSAAAINQTAIAAQPPPPPPPPAEEDDYEPPPRKKSGGGNGVLVGAIIALALFVCICLPGAALGLFALASSDGGTATASTAPTATPSGPVTPTATVRAGATPTPTVRVPPTPTVRVPPTAIPVGRVLFQDQMNASSDPNGWGTSNDANGLRTFYRDGVFHMENKSTTSNYVIFPTKSATRYTNFAYEVDFAKVGGPDTARYGLKFRADTTSLEGYNFFITADGRFEVTRWVESLRAQGGYDRMIEPTADTLGAIKPGNAKNRMKVVARGPEITIYVNDVHLATVREDKPGTRTSGAVGLMVGPDGMYVTVSVVRVFEVQ